MSETVFGRYRLLSLIGEGGMGKVYKAHDTVIDRDVAVKVLPAELAAEPGYRERFRREAYTAARLSEPHIIPIYDTGEFEGQLYLVMPVVDGIDLEGLLKRDGKLSPRRAVAVIEQLAAALDAAHAVGLVHRDVKPSNALLTGHDFAYLIDFGIAHDAEATKMTRTGMIIGSFAYMAPERFTSDTADARADIYALTCVLYECLTGARPYPGDSVQQQVSGHIAHDPPIPTNLDPTIPVRFDEVIARGMAKDPDLRYGSAHELATAAREALTNAPSSHTAPTLLDSSRRPSAPVVPSPTQPRVTAGNVPGRKVNPYDVPVTRPAGAPRGAASAPQSQSFASSRPQNRSPDQPPASSSTSPPGTPARGGSRRRRRKRPLIVAGTVVLTAIVAVVAGYLFRPHSPVSQTQSAPPTPPEAPATQQIPAGGSAAQPPAQPASSSGPTVLSFARLSDVTGVAVDSAGNVYAAEGSGAVLELAAGATTSVQLPFSNAIGPGVAVDSANTVYASAFISNGIWKLPAGSNTPSGIPFEGMKCGQLATPAPMFGPRGVAVDTFGTVYVADEGGCPGGRVLMLSTGSGTPIDLPFAGLNNPAGLAVDDSGNVFVTDTDKGQVLELAAGSTREVALPFTDLHEPGGIAVDKAGSVYVSDTRGDRVLKLAAGSKTPSVLPIQGVHQPKGLAVDSSGNLYVADNGNNRVLKLAPG